MPKKETVEKLKKAYDKFTRVATYLYEGTNSVKNYFYGEGMLARLGFNPLVREKREEK